MEDKKEAARGANASGGNWERTGGTVILSVPQSRPKSQFNFWPDVGALADLIVAEVQLAQPNPPDDAYFRWFDAWGRYWSRECVL